MYRFRSVENLIGKYQELEKQQIYMADREELNDPMEGERRYFWKGDKIVWKNFLKHYVLCLEHVILLSRLLPEDKRISKNDIPIYKCEENLPSDLYKERIKKINKDFFSDKFIQEYLNFLIANPNNIYIEEMYVHLKIITGKALEYIFEADVEAGFISTEKFSRAESVQDIDFSNLSKMFDEGYKSKFPYTEFMEIIYNFLREQDTKSLFIYKDYPKIQSVMIEFPKLYLDKIAELVYPKVYIACFMDNCLNSSIWGTYGNNHTGVCLKFKTDKENPILSLKDIDSDSSTNRTRWGYRDYNMKPIKYSYEYEELDFFANMGRLTVKQLKEQWYSDDEGNLSESFKNLYSDKGEWRSRHWEKFEAPYLSKTPDWSHEKEYRIILSSVLDDFINPQNRLLEYKFEDLESIIFGMKTPIEAKTKIIEIIKKKCEENHRESFDFYEMVYSNSKNGFYPRKVLTI